MKNMNTEPHADRIHYVLDSCTKHMSRKVDILRLYFGFLFSISIALFLDAQTDKTCIMPQMMLIR